MAIVNYNLTEDNFEQISSDLKLSRQLIDFLSETSLVFASFNELNTRTRTEIRRINSKYPQDQLVLVSDNIQLSDFAWKINAFYFLEVPIRPDNISQLLFRLNDYYLGENHPLRRMTVNFKGGTKIIDIDSISVIKGKGNYCHFYFRTDKSDLFTLRISDVGERLKHIPSIVRVNKSLIVNMDNLLRIESGAAYFRGDKRIKLNLSRQSQMKLKKELLWMDY